MNQIVSQIKKVACCSEHEKSTFYHLLCQAFLGVSWHEFVRDFQEKDAVIILRKNYAAGEIVGFSTLMVLHLALPDENVKAIFSGDTVVLPEYRSSTGLGVEIGRYFIQVGEQFPQHKVYYILISKGWRSYKILPFFFKEFSPHYDQLTPACIKAVMNVFGQTKYPGYYQPATGIVVFGKDAARLRLESIDSVPTKVDAHTRFFLQCNPGYLQGDELVCVARIVPANFSSALNRLLRSANLL